MRNLKRALALVLTLVLAFALTATSCAAQGEVAPDAAPSDLAVELTISSAPFSDVAADAWYADAVDYVRANGLMSGTGDTTFSPNGSMTRAMLATVLYRVAGEPDVTGTDDFTDTAEGTWYTDAVLWAATNNIISGYGNGLFGTNDPVTREQIAAILWRYEGSPAPAGTGETFADQSAIASYAADAVAWARESGIINGLADGRFDPKGSATRAQVATILMNYLDDSAPAPAPTPEPTPEETGRTLIAYFSATGNTENVAGHLSAILDADLYEIVPETPYTAADLNYSDPTSRSQVERNDPAARPAIDGSVDNMADYDVVFVGYPIWNGQAPKIISTFLESYDLSGKTIVPFCTSGSSGIGSSATSLQALTPDANWLAGQRFGGSATRAQVESWVDTLALPQPQNAPTQEETVMQISVSDGTHTVTYTLNDSQAARDLYAQLPLTLTIENYSTNEKIFYPPDALTTTGAPLATGGAGVLAYYAPWGNVVLFYGSFNDNSSLFALGTVVSGGDQISALSGTVTVARAV